MCVQCLKVSICMYISLYISVNISVYICIYICIYLSRRIQCLTVFSRRCQTQALGKLQLWPRSVRFLTYPKMCQVLRSCAQFLIQKILARLAIITHFKTTNALAKEYSPPIYALDVQHHSLFLYPLTDWLYLLILSSELSTHRLTLLTHITLRISRFSFTHTVTEFTDSLCYPQDDRILQQQVIGPQSREVINAEFSVPIFLSELQCMLVGVLVFQDLLFYPGV